MTYSVRPPNGAATVRIRGRNQPFLERRRIGRADYFLLERVGSPWRERYRAFDPQAGPGGDFFLVQELPVGPLAEQQLRVLKRLKHDSFPRVWHWQRRQSHVEVVSSWIDGITLAEYLGHIRAGRRPPVDPGQAVRLIHGLASAVCLLHQKLQVAHGDIHPANVIITSHPSRLVLIDFGSAWTVQTAASRLEGDGQHRLYAAPELQTGQPASGFLADQFSVSVILYELLTGQLPYGGLGGKAGRSEYVAQAADALVAPSLKNTSCRQLPGLLRASVDRLAMRGLALNAQHRYPDRAWLNDLFEVSARLRLAPELPPTLGLITRVVQWLVRPGR